MTRHARYWPMLAAVVAMIGAASPAWCDDADLIKRLERQMRQYDEVSRQTVPADQPISERMLFDFGGSARFGFLSVDDAQGDARLLRQYDGLLYLRAELDGAHRFYGRLRFLYNDFDSDGDSFDGDGDEFEDPIADRYWYQFDLRGLQEAQSGEHSDFNVNIKAGRQFVHWGAGLALSDVLWAGVFDVELGDFGAIGVVGLTPDDNTVDFDGSRPEFDENTSRLFYGGMFEYRGFAEHRPYVGFLMQRDRNDNNDVFGPSAKFGYDSEYLSVGSKGAIGPVITYRVEIIHETGEAYSDPLRGPQSREDVDAWAGVITMVYTLRDENNTRTEFEFIGASGDGDRLEGSDTIAGNLTGTDDNAFNSLGYVNTGLALAPEMPNLMMMRMGLSTAPAVSLLDNDWLRVGINGFLFFKTDNDAAMNIATDTDRFVGGEIDLLLDYRITSDLSTSLRYGVFLPGDAIPESQNNIRHFFYWGVTYAF